MTDILLSTTPTIEGMPIEKYYGIVSANQVAGTGFFTDFTASFSDFFGGKSGAYRESMNKLYYDVVDQIKEKARDLGANAIVGVKIDYDNISAKNMSMFMVSIFGTAVKLQIQDDAKSDAFQNEISRKVLNYEYCKSRILRKLESDKILDSGDWEFVLENPDNDFIGPLYEYYLKCRSESAGNSFWPEWVSAGLKNFMTYLSTLDYKNAVEIAYKDVSSFKKVIEDNKLFNAKKIEELAVGGQIDQAISLLSVEKESYSDVDLSEMKSLLSYLSNLPEVGKKEEVKGGLFSSKGLKFVCVCGCKNDSEDEFCAECGRNIQGITAEQVKQIKHFEELIEVLTRLLKV